MGGSIGFTVRLPNGTEHRMTRWTNPIPDFIHNMKFINKDLRHFEEYQTQWNGMREDWLKHTKRCNKKNHINCKFNYLMTPVYAPYPYLAPTEYGLIVVDMMNNVIISCQGYSKIGQMYLMSQTEGNKWERAQKFLDEGRVLSIYKDFKPIRKPVISLNKLKKRKLNLYTVNINLSPFRVIEVPEKNYTLLKKEVLKQGFKLTDEEEKIWAEEIKESIKEGYIDGE